MGTVTSGRGHPGRLRSWLRPLSTTPAKTSRATMVRLTIEDGEPVEARPSVHQWTLEAALAGGDEWISEVIDAAQADCDGRATVTAYSLSASTTGGGIVATHSMRMRPDDEIEGVREAASQTGIIGQLMRHQEAQARVIAHQSMQMSTLLERQSQSLTAITDAQTRLLEALRDRALEAEERIAAMSSGRDDDAPGQLSPALDRLATIAERALLGDGGADD